MKNHEEDIELILAIYYKAVGKERSISKGYDRPDKTFYIYPDRPLPVSTVNHSSPEKVEETYKMGREAAENLLRFVDFHNKFFFSS